MISIHAPRERCDVKGYMTGERAAISIHAPRERCDCCFFLSFATVIAFQSTHRVSDATFIPTIWSARLLFQSTHRVSDATQV